MLGMGGSASLATRIPLRDVQLFQAQGFHRVFGSGTARGDESGEECRLGEYGGDSGESWNVQRADAEEESAHQARRGDRARCAERNAERDHAPGFPQNELINGPGLRAQSDADADFTAPPDRGVQGAFAYVVDNADNLNVGGRRAVLDNLLADGIFAGKVALSEGAVDDCHVRRGRVVAFVEIAAAHEAGAEGGEAIAQRIRQMIQG